MWLSDQLIKNVLLHFFPQHYGENKSFISLFPLYSVIKNKNILPQTNNLLQDGQGRNQNTQVTTIGNGNSHYL